MGTVMPIAGRWRPLNASGSLDRLHTRLAGGPRAGETMEYVGFAWLWISVISIVSTSSDCGAQEALNEPYPTPAWRTLTGGSALCGARRVGRTME